MNEFEDKDEEIILFFFFFKQVFVPINLLQLSYTIIFPEEMDGGITVSKFCKWLTGQGHKPLDIDHEEFKIVIEFEHDCKTHYGSHTICFPIVNACAQTLSLPVEHMGTYTDFRNAMCHAITHGFEFSRC